MTKKIPNKIVTLLLILLIGYLLLPEPDFPPQLPESFKSTEPADREDPLRQAYYTDWDRAQIMAFYMKQFDHSPFFGIPLPTLKLNYPHEEAQTIIRDQTQSRYLEEFAHPLKESIFVNGFFAQKDSERMYANAREYKTKIIVKYVRSNPVIRLTIALSASALGLKILSEFINFIRKFRHA